MLNNKQRKELQRLAYMKESNASLDANKLAITANFIQVAMGKVNSAVSAIEDCLHTTEIEEHLRQDLNIQRKKLRALLNPLQNASNLLNPQMGGTHMPSIVPNPRMTF